MLNSLKPYSKYVHDAIRCIAVEKAFKDVFGFGINNRAVFPIINPAASFNV